MLKLRVFLFQEVNIPHSQVKVWNASDAQFLKSILAGLARHFFEYFPRLLHMLFLGVGLTHRQA